MRDQNSTQLTFTGFAHSFDLPLSSNNDWVILARSIPWTDLTTKLTGYIGNESWKFNASMRVIIGALIVQHKLDLTECETVEMISDNVYMQYFCGYSSHQKHLPFDESVFADLRRIMGQLAYKEFNAQIIEAYTNIKKPKQNQVFRKRSIE